MISSLYSRGNVTVACIRPSHNPTVQITKSKNVTVNEGHAEILKNLQQNRQSFISKITLGTGGENGTSVGDTDLNNPVIDGDIFSTTQEQNTITFSAFIGQNFSTSDPINEVGLFTNSDVLINHAQIDPIVKDQNSILIISIELELTDGN